MSGIRHHTSPTSDLAKAYGALWRNTGASTPEVLEARRLLLGLLTKKERALGIEWANERFGPMTDAEARGIDLARVTPEERLALIVPSFPVEDEPPRKALEDDGTVEKARDRILAGWLAQKPGEPLSGYAVVDPKYYTRIADEPADEA